MMMGKNILFLAPSGLDIYKDVITGLEEKGFQVDYVSSSDVPNNPFQPISSNCYTEENVRKFEEKVTAYWKEKLSDIRYLKKYDIFFTINGLMTCPYLFEHLHKINPQIKCKLYLYDKIAFACHIERYFHYYDDIFSFDLGDVATYNLNFLPIYWVQLSEKCLKQYDLFGMASYSLHKKNRALLFREIKQVSDNLNLNSFIKLYVKMDNWPKFLFKNLVKLCMHHKTYIPFKDVFNGIVTNKSLSPSKFRRYIYESDVILDTHVEYQDGLTARFMWALGAEKKIITTNKMVKQYDFYTPEQFFILNEDPLNSLSEFLNLNFTMTEKNRNIILNYRIDNWLETILK